MKKLLSTIFASFLFLSSYALEVGDWALIEGYMGFTLISDNDVEVYWMDGVDVDIPPTVTYEGVTYNVVAIADVARWEEGLQSVTFPETLVRIGDDAFRNCTNLQKIDLPNSITQIGNYAFYGCHGLKEAKLPEYITEISTGLFWDCTRLEKIVIPNNVTTIGNVAFYHCYSLQEVSIPNSVKEKGEDTFTDCPIERLYIDMAEIPVWFRSLNTLKYVGFGPDVISIGNASFQYCTSLFDVDYGYSQIISIGEGAFGSCISLDKIIIPDGVEEIGVNAFSGCVSASELIIGDNVKIIGDGAFSLCSGLSEVNIPDSVVEIGYGCFSNCYNIKTVTIGKSVETGGYGAFATSGVETAIINCADIPDYLFSDCTTLREVIFADGTLTIGEGAFSSCSRLNSIRIPDSVTEIKRIAFMNCTDLKFVELGQNLKFVGSDAFAECSSLTKVLCKAVPSPVLGDRVFDGIPADAILYVFADAIADYRQSFWSIHFKEILSIEENGVDDVYNDSVSEIFDIYDIDGRLIRRGVSSTALMNLTPGIYLVKGHKILVR